jgi:hypothetical protein
MVEFLSSFQGQMDVKVSYVDRSLVRCVPITAHIAGEERPSASVSVHDRFIFFSPDLLQIKIIPAFSN